MLYSLVELLQDTGWPGVRLMDYITFRAGAAFVIGLLFVMFVGRKMIDRLQRMQIGEIVRELSLEGQMAKKGTPTMGGVIIILGILVACLLVGNLGSIYMLLMLLTTVWLGTIGFLDDYMKFKKRNKDGIKGKYKIIGQIGIGLIVGVTMYLSPSMVMVENNEVVDATTNEIEVVYDAGHVEKSPQTTIPFVKNHNFDYSWLTSWAGPYAETGGWIVFIAITIFLVAATSNGANLNDGLDGMCAGLSAISAVALMAMAYLGGNIIYSSYLNIMYLPGSGELVVYLAAFIGALVGFLWYNASPAEVFMGDTGSLMLGGVIAVVAVLIHKELLLPILCALFYIEDLSVILQVAYYKHTGGRRIFKMTPLHHHFQKPGDGSINAIIQAPRRAIPESKIVTRFWIIAMILAVVTFVTLKIR